MTIQDEDRLRRLAAPIERAQAGVDMRGRTPAEIADQLQRDATSLEMTGASFEKDQQFYQHVAANVREAAAFLARWQSTIEALQRDKAEEIRGARMGSVDACISSAEIIRNSVPNWEGPASTWREATGAVINALVARRDSMRGPRQQVQP